MRPRKLSKSSKTKNSFAADDWIDAPDLTFKASLDDLRSQTSRQSLRQHFTGAFPETQLRPSLEFEDMHTTPRMRSRGRVPRKSSDATMDRDASEMTSSSTTSVNSTEMKMKRLSTVRENSNGKIDIAEMVVLLQELKKTASPAEMVALHKALQPTNHSTPAPSPGLRPTVEDARPHPPRSPFIRRRSMAPPGVATRKSSADPLRTPEEVSAASEKPRPRTQPTSKTELAALDLADDQVTATTLRSSLDLDITHMGAYRPGTLRIMNGRASPDPSLLFKETEVDRRSSTLPEDFQTAPNTPDRGQTLPLRQSTSNTGEIRETVVPYKEKRQVSGRLSVQPSPNLRSNSAPEVRRASEPTVSCSLKPQKDEIHPLRALKTTPFQRASVARDQARDRAHSQADLSQHQQQSRNNRTVNSSPVTQRNSETPRQSTTVSSRQSLEPNTNTIVDPKRSSATATALQREPSTKTSMPRFAQRWSQRLSHLASESTTETQLPSNPFEDNSALQSLSRRLGTVTDRTIRERQESSARETPEVALAKLTGEIDNPIIDRTSESQHTDRHQTPISSADDLYNPRSCRSSQPQKTDSGYASDALPASKEAKQPNSVDTANVYTITEQTHKAYDGLRVEDETVSLYSLGQVLTSPYLLSGLAIPSPPAARGSKKHMSLLGINKAEDLENADAAAAEHPDLSPIQTKPVRSHKKLQKPMPATVRNSFKAALTRKDEKRASKNVVCPDFYDDLEDTFAQYFRSEELHNAADGLLQDQKRKVASCSSEFTELPETTADRTNSIASVSVFQADEGQATRTHQARNNEVDATLDSVRDNTNNNKQSGDTTPRASQFEMSNISCFNIAPETSEARVVTVRGPLTSHPPTPSTAAFNPSTKLLNRRVSIPKVHAGQGRPTKENESSFRRPRNVGGGQGAQSEMEADASRRHSRLMARQQNEQVLESLGFIPTLTKRKSKMEKKAASEIKEHLRTKRLPPTPVEPTSERPGDSTESIADVVRKAAEARKANREGLQHPALRESRPPKGRKSRIKEASRVEIYELEGSSTEEIRIVPSESERLDSKDSKTEYTAWEQHAETWRQQREFLAHKLVTPSPPGTEQNDDTPPTIVVSGPISDRHDTHRALSDSAEKQAQAYRNLIDNDKSSAPSNAVAAVGHTTTKATNNHTQKRESQDLEEQIDSVYALKSYDSQAPQIERSRSPGGRVVTPAGHFHPYTTAAA